MTTLYISEFAGGALNGLPYAAQPSRADQTVAIGATSAQSSAFGANTRLVRLHADAICSVAFGANPTAAATNARMVAGQTEYFTVKPGDIVAVITNT